MVDKTILCRVPQDEWMRDKQMQTKVKLSQSDTLGSQGCLPAGQRDHSFWLVSITLLDDVRARLVRGRLIDNRLFLPGHYFLPHKLLGNIPDSASTCSTSSLLTANAQPVFCRFQLRSVVTT